MADFYVDKNGNITNTKKKKKKDTSVDLAVDKNGNISVVESDTDDIAPVKNERRKWFQAGAFEDGYQFGDVVKSVVGTAADVVTDVAHGVGNFGEGIVDLIMYGESALSDLFGDEERAAEMKKKAQKNSVTDFFDKYIDPDIDELSLLGDKSDSIAQGVGYVLPSIGLAAVSGGAGLSTLGTSALTTGTTFASNMGSGMSEAYQGGATDSEALKYGVSSGLIEAGTEMIFGGLGKGVNALGISRGIGGLDDIFAKKVSSKISNQFWKNAAQMGVKAMGEGVEEVLAGYGSAVAKKMTYMSDSELKDLVKDENLLESFVSGMFVSGIVQGNSLIKSNKGKTDFVTGLTQNEEAVVESIYNEAVKEAEAKGEKLSGREKNKIYEETVESLKRGDISVDTIEKVLGGDNFKTYDELKAESEEYKKLYETKSGELSEAQRDRLAELKAKNTEQSYEERLAAEKDKASQSVVDLVAKERNGQGGYLAVSYTERTKRGQAFEADLSQYKNEKQQEVVKKAVESGILNNTRRTHEFVEMVSKISADKGVLFDFTNNERLKESGFAKDGRVINGYVTKDGITLNVNSAKSLNTVVGHEIAHVLEGTELYGQMQSALFEYARSRKDFDGRRAALEELYRDVEGANVDNELTADLVGDYLFTDQEFINNLSVKNKNVFQKIYDEIKYLCKVVTAGSKEARQLEEVKRKFEQAYKSSESAKKSSESTKYSITSDSDGNKLTNEQSEYFKDSKMRDDNGNLKVMYHGSQDAGFHVFDPAHSDDDISLFFVDRNDVAASYSGTTETYEAKTVRTAEDVNNFIESIGIEGYEALEHDGVFDLLYEGELIASSDSAKGIYEEFCWYEGVGEGDANYKVYLNLVNPLIVDAEGRNWHRISSEFSQDIYDRYQTLTAEEKDALTDLAEWEDFSLFNQEIESALQAVSMRRKFPDRLYAPLDENTKNLASAFEKIKGGDNVVDFYGLFDIAADNFSEETIRESSVKQLNTRDYAQRAKEQGYDGVIFNNIVDVGGYGNGSEGASTVAIAFNSEQVKSVANEKPTSDPDIRYSLTEYTAEEKKAHNKAVLEHFGKTYSWAEAGYLLLDGSRLDLSGKHEGAPGGYRTVDHRDIVDALGDDYGNGDYSGSLVQFMSEGNIRIIPECNGINLSVKPTKAQEQALSNYISRYRGEVLLDIDDLNGNTVVSVEYPYGTYYTTVLNDIREWFDNGKKPENAGNYSLTKEGDAPRRFGNYNVKGEEISLNLGPVREDIAKNATTTTENVAPTTNNRPAAILYNVRDGENGWGEFYGTAQEALNDAVKNTNNELWNAFTEEWDNALTNTNLNGATPITNALIAVQEDVRQQTITPIQGARLLNEAYKRGGVDALKRLYNPKTGNLYNQYLEKAKQYETVAPAQENLASDMPSEPTLADLRRRLDEINEIAQTSDDYKEIEKLAPEYIELTEKIKRMEADEAAYQKGRISSIDDADAPPESIAPYYDDNGSVSASDPFENRDMHEVGNQKVKAYMYENPEVKPFFQEEANVMLGELNNTTKGERFPIIGEDGYISGWTGTKRQTTEDIAYLLDNGKGNGRGYTYDEIRAGLKAIIEDNGKENNAVSKRIEFLLNDRLMKGYQDLDGYDIPANEEYINLLTEKQITEYNEESFKSFMESGAADRLAPPIVNKDNIGPVKDTKQGEPTGTPKEPGKTAEILTEEPEAPKKKERSVFTMARTALLDKFTPIEDLALKHKNRELMGKANHMLSSESRAQHMIGKGIKSRGVKSLNEIRSTVEKSGLKKEFFDYLHHMHNADRMSLEANAKATMDSLQGKFGRLKTEQIYAIAAKEITDKTTARTAETIRQARDYVAAMNAKNKPVFGDDVTADVSRKTATKLEKAHPEFKAWAKDVYDYNNYLREILVKKGVVSQETADLWAKIYPHYVPIRRAGHDGAAVNVALDTNKTGVDAPIKRATGGNSDILPLWGTMASRTEQTYRAAAKNAFGVELMNVLGTRIENSKASLDEVLDSVDNHEELLQKGQNGASPTFTVFENGERVTFEITEDLYDALKPTSDGLKTTIKPLNIASKAQRGLLTEYNPVFMLTNAIKDAQDVLINSQHAAKTYMNFPKAIKELVTKGKWLTEYIENGGEQNTYFEGESKTFTKDDAGIKKVLGFVPRKISEANNFIERIPRLAEYIASREAGRSIEVSMLDAARVTTNFAAGGDVTKMLNRNGFTFLNASVQGFNQQVRNIREAKANGLKGWVQLAAKVTFAGLSASLLNHLLWDDDEEYAELSDYVKDNYYVIAKNSDGTFVRIPKGRTMAVIQDAFEQMENLITGNDEVDLKNFLDLAISNLAPNDPLNNNVIAPISQAITNKTWYGEDLVPTRLQDLPNAEQYDESTDAISKWLGEKINVSPYKLNYLLNQYSGGLGDVVLPMLTPEAERGDDSFGGNLIAPLKDKFTTNAVTNNQNTGDFYDTMDELTKKANSSYATDEDILKYKYFSSINSQLGELYGQKREIQNSDLSSKEKYSAAMEVQKQINDLTRNGLGSYNNVNIDGVYATVGDVQFRWYEPGEDSTSEPGWQKISDKQLEKQEDVTSTLGITPSQYWSNKEEYDFAYEYPARYAVAKSVGGYEAYRTYSSELYDIKADKDSNGKSITGSRKKKVIDYINNLDADYETKIILYKSEYTSDDRYNYDIVNYLNSREDLSYEEVEAILKSLGFEVDSRGRISW